MYNRYIPQQDGSFQRRPAPDKTPAPPKPQQEPPAPPVPPPAPRPQPAACFLRNLLPREIDTGDLIVVLLLILMAGDCEQERNTALLTLALYFLL